jgi:hypothetical protein
MLLRCSSLLCLLVLTVKGLHACSSDSTFTAGADYASGIIRTLSTRHHIATGNQPHPGAKDHVRPVHLSQRRLFLLRHHTDVSCAAWVS